MIQAPYNFYLFADNLTNNFAAHLPDVFHNDGSGTLCTDVLKFIDCTTAADGADDPNERTVVFGLYAQNTGAFTKAVQLTSAPGRLGGSTTVYGFAGRVDADGDCPPGLEKKESYEATPSDLANSNLDQNLTDTVVLDPDSTTNTMTVLRITGGSCPGDNTCTAPDVDFDNGSPTSSTQQTVTYTQQNDEFCVIPASLVENL